MAHTKFISPHCQSCRSRNASLFACCQPKELELLDDGKSCQVFKKGQVIFQEGNRPNGLHCIHEGKVKVTKMGGDGKEQIIRLAKPGDIMGYRALMAESNYSASAVAMEDSVVCYVPKSDFLQLVEQNIQLTSGLMRLLSRTLGDAEERMLHMAYKPVRERLAEALLLLQKTYQQKEDEEPFSISISREDLASIVGTAKETTIRLLAEFKEEGILSAKGSTITINEPEKLVHISHLYD